MSFCICEAPNKSCFAMLCRRLPTFPDFNVAISAMTYGLVISASPAPPRGFDRPRPLTTRRRENPKGTARITMKS
eukprot:1102901-Pyramimonas_sp.AAC.1